MPNSKPVPTQDYTDAAAAVEKYVTGVQTGKWELIEEAFHKDATMHGYYGNDLNGGSFQALKAFIDEHGASPNMTTRIDILSITPTTAVARVDMEGAGTGLDYTDFHSLMKIDGRWRIFAKTFHFYG
ncbi:uncharacterized protein KD926_001265 [Aspergillus affinis]|uniref:uncharacterized protein n=1 Tax=Aspergillus affinis TaxID=1070780 RepID=UPI0022FE4BC7|nr:uncharacterized protein KD926_001265 [Aspergillus affinis]KAI9036810.1 hypothetical protein KD926_001265 [Aspergillus affinis]